MRTGWSTGRGQIDGVQMTYRVSIIAALFAAGALLSACDEAGNAPNQSSQSGAEGQVDRTVTNSLEAKPETQIDDATGTTGTASN